MNKEDVKKLVWSAEGLALAILFGMIAWLIIKR